MTSRAEAIILCGGLGTRLRPLYSNIPKALVPICGRPFIEYIVEWLRAQGVRHIHLAAGYRAGQLGDWAREQRLPGINITVSVEPSPLGTAGGIKFTLPFIKDCKRLLVLNGDSLLPNASVQDLSVMFDGESDFKAVLAAVEMTERGRYGTVDISPDHRITAFREKSDQSRGFVNGGIYLMDPAILDNVPEGRPASLEQEIFPGLAAAGYLGAVKVAGPLLDMGTPEGLERMEQYLSGGSGA